MPGDRCQIAGPKPGSSGRISCTLGFRGAVSYAGGCRLTRGARLRYCARRLRDGGSLELCACGATRRRLLAAACWLFKGQRLRGGRRAGQYRIEPDARASGRLGQGCGVRAGGGDRDRRAAVEQAGLLGLRRARTADQGAPDKALAGAGSGRLAMRDRVPAAAPVLPGLRGRVRGGAVGEGGLALHARVRRSDRVAGATDEPDAGRAAAADRVAHGRQDPRAGRRRQARFRPAGRASVDRRGDGVFILHLQQRVLAIVS